MSRNLILRSYDLDPDRDPDTFDQSLRSNEYPAVRSKPSVLEFAGFKVVKNHVGRAPFSRFDLMFVNNFERYEEDAGDIEATSDGRRNVRVDFARDIWG